MWLTFNSMLLNKCMDIYRRLHGWGFNLYKLLWRSEIDMRIAPAWLLLICFTKVLSFGKSPENISACPATKHIKRCVQGELVYLKRVYDRPLCTGTSYVKKVPVACRTHRITKHKQPCQHNRRKVVMLQQFVDPNSCNCKWRAKVIHEACGRCTYVSRWNAIIVAYFDTIIPFDS